MFKKPYSSRLVDSISRNGRKPKKTGWNQIMEGFEYREFRIGKHILGNQKVLSRK